MTPHYHWLLFDADGTLFDYDRGDSLSSDIEGAVSYGIDACWYNPMGQPRPARPAITYEIRQLSGLLDLLE